MDDMIRLIWVTVLRIPTVLVLVIVIVIVILIDRLAGLELLDCLLRASERMC